MKISHMDDNNRFMEVLDYLKMQGLISNYVDVAKSLGTNKAGISDIKHLRKKIPIDILRSMNNSYPNINIEWIITGEGSMLKSDGENTANSLPVAKPADPKLGIPLIPSEAFCGYGTPTFDDQAVEEFYYVAEFKQADFLIRVKGNSMYPKYSSGDIIACRKVNELLYFQWNKIYAIYTNSQGIMVKRVRESSKGDDYVTLISDNPNYAPFDIPRSDISSIAIVIGVIRLE